MFTGEALKHPPASLTHLCPLCRVARRAAFFFFCRFRNMGILRDRVVIPVPNPLTWRTGGSRFVGPLPFDLSCFGGPTRRRCSRWHSFRGLRGTQARRPRHGGDPSGDPLT